MKLKIGRRRSNQRAKPLLGVYWECPSMGLVLSESRAGKLKALGLG